MKNLRKKKLDMVENIAELSERELYSLATDSDEIIRMRLADQPNLPNNFALILSNDTSVSVRGLLAENASISDEVLFNLSRDPDELVRLTVIRNPKTPAFVLDEMVGDISPYIAERAMCERNRRNKERDLLMEPLAPCSDIVREAREILGTDWRCRIINDVETKRKGIKLREEKKLFKNY